MYVVFVKCVLAAVILVALKGMFMQFKQLPHLWRVSLQEFVNLYLIFMRFTDTRFQK